MDRLLIRILCALRRHPLDEPNDQYPEGLVMNCWCGKRQGVNPALPKSTVRFKDEYAPPGECIRCFAARNSQTHVRGTPGYMHDYVNPADPPHTDDAYFEHDEQGWWFWAEDWATRYGPHASREEAEAALDRYAKEVLG